MKIEQSKLSFPAGIADVAQPGQVQQAAFVMLLWKCITKDKISVRRVNDSSEDDCLFISQQVSNVDMTT